MSKLVAFSKLILRLSTNKTSWLRLLGLSGVLMLLGVLLAACDDEKSPQDVQNSIKTAIAVDGKTPLPTLDPSHYVGGEMGIINLHDFNPANPDEAIKFIITNGNETSFYAGSCGTPVLQRKDGTKWVDIGPGKPCAPSGPLIVQIPPFSKPINADFVFSQTRPFKGQTWNIDGIYRLYFTLYLTCPRGSQLLKDCIDQEHMASEEFHIVGDAASSNAPVPAPTSANEVGPFPLPTTAK